MNFGHNSDYFLAPTTEGGIWSVSHPSFQKNVF
jgi:hypothetical protein